MTRGTNRVRLLVDAEDGHHGRVSDPRKLLAQGLMGIAERSAECGGMLLVGSKADISVMINWY